MASSDTVSVSLSEKDLGILRQACNVLVKTADNALQAAADVLPVVMKLQSPAQADSEEVTEVPA